MTRNDVAARAEMTSKDITGRCPETGIDRIKTSFDQQDRREKALWAVSLLAYTLRALDLYPTRLRALAYSAVMSEAYTRPERVAGLFLGTLERALAGALVKA